MNVQGMCRLVLINDETHACRHEQKRRDAEPHETAAFARASTLLIGFAIHDLRPFGLDNGEITLRFPLARRNVARVATLVWRARKEPQERIMKTLLLWLVGVPIPLILIAYLVGWL